jgi:hypothetical protein
MFFDFDGFETLQESFHKMADVAAASVCLLSQWEGWSDQLG